VSLTSAPTNLVLFLLRLVVRYEVRVGKISFSGHIMYLIFCYLLNQLSRSSSKDNRRIHNVGSRETFPTLENSEDWCKRRVFLGHFCLSFPLLSKYLFLKEESKGKKGKDKRSAQERKVAFSKPIFFYVNIICALFVKQIFRALANAHRFASQTQKTSMPYRDVFLIEWFCLWKTKKEKPDQKNVAALA